MKFIIKYEALYSIVSPVYPLNSGYGDVIHIDIKLTCYNITTQILR